MNAKPIFDALAALTAVRELKWGQPVPSELWSRVMQAETRLEAELKSVGLIVDVVADQPERAAA